MEGMIVKIIARILSEINSNESVRNFVRGLGEFVADVIPGNKIEPQIIEFLVVFKEGVLKHQEERLED